MTKIINGVASEFEFPADTGVFTQNVFEKENQELKKQVDEYKKQLKPNYYVKGLEGTLKEYQQEMGKVATQQKEFIKYLEDLIKQNETVVEVSKYGLPKNCSKLLIDFYKVILSKYKEIIGVKDE
jgi:hypothetical protein|nr:MAG TPA: hypothetical protein [Bacteriophage sp.]